MNTDYPVTDARLVTIYPVDESTSRTFSGHLVSDGEAVTLGDLTALTLTVRQDYSRAIVNGREQQDVLNTNFVTVETIEENTVLTWHIQSLDTELLNRSLPEEPHRCLFEWTYVTGGETKQGGDEFILMVKRHGAK